jgi:hypothetical protein
MLYFMSSFLLIFIKSVNNFRPHCSLFLSSASLRVMKWRGLRVCLYQRRGIYSGDFTRRRGIIRPFKPDGIQCFYELSSIIHSLVWQTIRVYWCPMRWLTRKHHYWSWSKFNSDRECFNISMKLLLTSKDIVIKYREICKTTADFGARNTF